MDLVINCVTTKYATFSGRAPRKEYWLFVLAGFIFGFIAAVFDIVIGTGGVGYYGLIGSILMLAILIPSLAVGVRRLHDIDRSGWWYLIVFVH